ncbi:MAG: hypothetical protein BMS9Abin37_0566 [Acidobacteriota bacterium]|nr:MAG: hypothetical protein BMS9Abin37_0566 [Acidobacteriota bacterium]
MRIDPEDYLQRHVFVTGRWEDETTQLVRALLKPGDSFVDVGAHVGYFTLLAADALQYGGRVHAFEPVPRSFELLENNVRSNESARRATPERVARSSTPSARAAVRMERVEHETLSEVMS